MIDTVKDFQTYFEIEKLPYFTAFCERGLIKHINMHSIPEPRAYNGANAAKFLLENYILLKSKRIKNIVNNGYLNYYGLKPKEEA